MTQHSTRRALISVSDKTGLIPFAKTLQAIGFEILSTGGTAKTLADNGIKVTEVSELTQFPEMLDGRVKTLHPRIHGGLLARRDLAHHQQALSEHKIDTIDLLVVNLYPFVKTIAKPQCTLEEAIENIDIGGPAMLRSAAKNYPHVVVVCDPSDYEHLLTQLQYNTITPALRLSLAQKVFSHTAAYDGAIANYLNSLNTEHITEKSEYPTQLHLHFSKVQDLRYGENPHQSAAFYREQAASINSMAHAKQLQGKELSYNNIADADAAWECVKAFNDCAPSVACVIVKHANPCGVALANTAEQAYRKAFSTDPTSAFGGIIAFNSILDAHAARAVAEQFAEVIIAPEFTEEALHILGSKQNLRLLQIALKDEHVHILASDYKKVGGGLLVQTADQHVLEASALKIVTTLTPSEQQHADLLFAWRVAQFVKSNAIVFCRDQQTVGIGAGQMSRVDAARIASIKAENAGLTLQASVVASDAFFPFRDGLDVVIDAGACAVIQPGGSVRDAEVINAANEREIVMALTGVRHFRH